MNLDRFSGPGSTPSRRRFWDKVQSAVMASRKVAGRNITIDEHSGSGSVINAPNRSPTATACPCLTVTFSGVLIDCACYVPPGGGLSQLYTDGGNFNDITFGTVLDEDPPSCASCSRIHTDPRPQFHEKVYAPAEDCTGSPIVDSEENITGLAVARIGSTWHVAARFFTILFFYGNAPDLSSPISNQLLACNSTPTVLVNDFTDCLTDWAIPFVTLGRVGTVTVSPC